MEVEVLLVGDGNCSKKNFNHCSIQGWGKIKVHGQLFGVGEGG
jgi:hypothetical protein